jgi:hypothetical protein
MANSDNTFIIILESSKVISFNEQVKSKNYHFQDCKVNQAFQDVVQDTNYLNFFSTKVDSKSLFCAIKIGQARFFELEKIINSLGGAIESIEWPKSNEIITFEPAIQDFEHDNSHNNDPVSTKTPNLLYVLFTSILYGFIFHSIWAGLVLIAAGIFKIHKGYRDDRNYIFGGAFTILVGIICNSFLGNLLLIQLGARISTYFEWMNNLQLIDIVSKNDILPLNQLISFYNTNVSTFYTVTIFGLGLLFQILKYIKEIINFAKFSNLKLSTLRFYWLISIFLAGFVSFIYFRLNLINNLFWIPVVVFLILTFLNQSGNKLKEYLFGSFGILEYCKSFFKILTFGIVAIIGFSYNVLINELNTTFNNFFLRGWDYNYALIVNILLQSVLTYIFIWISYKITKFIINFAK